MVILQVVFFSSSLLLRSDSTILLTSSVHFSSLLLLFWFESLLSIITVSFESQSSPHHYIVISRSRFLLAKPLQRTVVPPIISPLPTHLLTTWCHSGTVSPLVCSISHPAPPLTGSQRFNISLSFLLCR
ncbi:hypothetical protein BDM02DRAFT_3260193 [Thelephora ganbajun]|uniref:Uncharacterized protein n=1 Tax=Thelephora ganbajun TaxID=370292 RepID=A0ACB6ZIR1_THEGA|nr:hypothetical protein BDM02DRAFT_3260193 [Thelephora ganbajun]